MKTGVFERLLLSSLKTNRNDSHKLTNGKNVDTENRKSAHSSTNEQDSSKTLGPRRMSADDAGYRMANFTVPSGYFLPFPKEKVFVSKKSTKSGVSIKNLARSVNEFNNKPVRPHKRTNFALKIDPYPQKNSGPIKLFRPISSTMISLEYLSP